MTKCGYCGSTIIMGGAAFSLLLGWWGFPWGLILTPVQITRNIIGMSRGPDSPRPSEALRKAVLVNLGLQMAKAAANQPSPQK